MLTVGATSQYVSSMLGDLYARILSPSVCSSALLGIEEDPEPAAESSQDSGGVGVYTGNCPLFMLKKSFSRVYLTLIKTNTTSHCLSRGVRGRGARR